MDTEKTNKKNLPDLAELMLLHGAHQKREEGVCLMEAVAWIAGEPHSDHPACTDVALAAYGRALNDRLKDDERQLLRPLVSKLVGTRGTRELAKRRAYFLVDRHVRVSIPAFLRELPRKPRPDLAERFEALSPVVDEESAYRARDLAREVRDGLWRDLPADAYAAAADAAYDADAAADAAYAYAAAYAAADAAAAAARRTRLAGLPKDYYLLMSARICEAILTEMQTPGAIWLASVEA